MKALKKILLWGSVSVVLIVLLFLILVSVRQNRTFEAPYPDIHASKDSALIKRGEYLAFGPAHCSECHGDPDMRKQLEAGLAIPLSGGFVFDIPPAKLHAPNITNDATTGIGNYKDEEIARALRYGVSKDGHALFDFMPFHDMSDYDLTAVISYLRAMPSVNHKVPKHEYTPLGNVLRALVIEPVGPSGPVPAIVNPDSSLEYGRYLANNVANCKGCHTNRDLKTGKYVGPLFAGGFVMQSHLHPEVSMMTPNLTPDKETGRMAEWDLPTFISRFRSGKLIPDSEMPWGSFKRMSDMELIAIYKFIQSQAPVRNETIAGVIETPK